MLHEWGWLRVKSLKAASLNGQYPVKVLIWMVFSLSLIYVFTFVLFIFLNSKLFTVWWEKSKILTIRQLFIFTAPLFWCPLAIVPRWGVYLLVTPRLAERLRPIFERLTRRHSANPSVPPLADKNISKRCVTEPVCKVTSNLSTFKFINSFFILLLIRLFKKQQPWLLGCCISHLAAVSSAFVLCFH